MKLHLGDGLSLPLDAVTQKLAFLGRTGSGKNVRRDEGRFFFRKKQSPSAVHLFLEECQEFIPQNTMRGEEHMLHAFTRLQKLGRNFGVGASLISQRPT